MTWFAICVECNRANIASLSTQKERDQWITDHRKETDHTEYEININVEPVK